MLSCVFMPSMVTFNAPLGSPLMVELRGVVGVDVPGTSTSNSTALRVANGRSVSCLLTSVWLTSALPVCTTSTPPVTSMTSVAWPRSHFMSTVAGTPEFICTADATPALKPVLVMATLYVAACIDGNAHSPRSLVTVLKTAPVATLVTVISAAGTAAPAGSVTVPSIRLVFICGNALIQSARKTPKTLNISDVPPLAVKYRIGYCSASTLVSRFGLPPWHFGGLYHSQIGQTRIIQQNVEKCSDLLQVYALQDSTSDQG